MVGHQVRVRAQPQWFAVALNAEDGKQLWKKELRGKPLPGGLLVDRAGQVIITMLGGDIRCLGTCGKGMTVVATPELRNRNSPDSSHAAASTRITRPALLRRLGGAGAVHRSHGPG